MNEATGFCRADAPAERAADAALALEFLQAMLAPPPSGAEAGANGVVAEALTVVGGWLADEPTSDAEVQIASLDDGLAQARHWAGAWLRRRGTEVTHSARPPGRQLALAAGAWLRLALRLMQAIGLHAHVSRGWECHAAVGPGVALDLRPVEAGTLAGSGVIRPLGDVEQLGRALAALIEPCGGRLEILPFVHSHSPEMAESATCASGDAPFAGWRLHLPAAATDSGAARAASVVLLYVEDDPINLLLVQELAALRPGVILHTAPDGQTGLAMARRLRPALIFVDLHLPDIDGFEVLLRLRAEEALADTPVLALSASTMPGMVERARVAGFVEYWRKPIHAERFLAGLDGWLARIAADRSK